MTEHATKPLWVSWDPEASVFVISTQFRYLTTVKTDSDLCLLLREYALNPEAVEDRERTTHDIHYQGVRWWPVERREAEERRAREEFAARQAKARDLTLDDLL